MVHAANTALLFICLVSGAEAARVDAARVYHEAQARTAEQVVEKRSARSSVATDTQKTMDLDWPGCGAKSGFNAYWCEDTEGCAIQKLWLDTPRQKCRFTDAHKLKRDKVTEFLPVELARLEEKTATFAQKGCLFGGWWAKCYRRMRQISRLLVYVRRAVEDAKADPTHPAHELAISPATTAKLKKAADNMAEGFRKHEAGKEEGSEFDAAYEKLKQLPDVLRQAADVSRENNQTLSEEETDTMEKTAAIEAMLRMSGITLNDEQRGNLFAKIEADKINVVDDQDELDKLVKSVVEASDASMDEADREDISNMQEAEETCEDDRDDIDDDNAKKEDAEQIASLLEVNQTRVATRGTGPLKFIFKNGLGWIVSRFAWLVLFLLGSALGIIRAGVMFPLFFVTCVLWKFLIWIFRDFGYNLLWEGEVALVGQRFKDIGRCAPVAWETVGFDASQAGFGEVAGEVFFQPARFASDTTGVYHFYKGSASLCENVRCGENAHCQGGYCYCNHGMYPITQGGIPSHGASANSCGPKQTTHECACKPHWTEGLWASTHYGCPGKRSCEVDTAHPTYATCQSRLPKDSGNWLMETVFGPKKIKDGCQPSPLRAQVEAL